MASGPQSRAGVRAVALRLLGRRPLTAEELRRALGERGFASRETAREVRRLEQQGLIDDRALALHYIAVRAERLGHGRERLVRELTERGIARATAERAWSDAVRQGSVEPEQLLARQAGRRVEREGGRLDVRAYRRVYNALLRAGFDPRSIRTRLEPYRDFPDDAGDVVADGIQDDLP